MKPTLTLTLTLGHAPFCTTPPRQLWAAVQVWSPGDRQRSGADAAGFDADHVRAGGEVRRDGGLSHTKSKDLGDLMSDHELHTSFRLLTRG